MTACGFKRSRYASILTSSYPTGQIGCLLAEKDPPSASSYNSVVTRYKRMISNGQATSYYHPPLQRGCVKLLLFGRLCIVPEFLILFSFVFLYDIIRRSFELPLWAHNHIYGTENTSDLLCKENLDSKVRASDS